MRFDLSLKISLLPLSFCFNILSNCLIAIMSLCLLVVFHPLRAIFYLVT